MSAIRDKLKLLGVEIAAPKPVSEQRSFDFTTVMDGRWVSTPAGEVFLSETVYPANSPWGRAALRFPSGLDPLCRYQRIPQAANFEPGDWLFIDTETTGLAGGSGTLAFMVGVGRFMGGVFRVRQYLIADPAREPALIAALTEEFSRARGVVSFNGKSFDLPLLDTRAILNGAHRFSPNAAHLDLLPVARRLWKQSVENCTLGCLEYRILDVLRTEADIAGHLIPMMFFEFLRTGDGSFFPDVAYHNRMDICTMTALLGAAIDAVNGVSGDSIARAEFLIRIGRVEEALPILAASPTSRMRLAGIYKQRRRIAEALPLWGACALEGDATACIELAKHHEHALRDPDSALRWTERAVSGRMTPRELADLEKRMHRLVAKIGRKTAGTRQITLRTPVETDLDDYRRWLRPDAEWTRWDGPWEILDEETAANWIERIRNRIGSDPETARRLEIDCDGVHAGWVTSYRMEDGEGRIALGITLAESGMWGCGIGQKAFSNWIAHWLDNLGAEEVYCETWSGNLRMIRLAERLGFVLCEERSPVVVDGQEYGRPRFRLTRAEYRKAKSSVRLS
jgi:uncharacterized protein